MRNLLLIAALIALASLLPARALTIDPTFDSTITSSSGATEIESAFNYAAQQIEDDFTNPITINIDVTSVSGTSTLGESNTQYDYSGSGPGVGYTYSQVKSALLSATTTSFSSQAAASLPSSNPTNGNFAIANAEQKALGLMPATGSENDGTFTFGTGYDYTFDPANRAVPDKTDFIGVAEHEITEIMGRSYLLGVNLYGNSNGPYYDPFDLYRFTAPGTRSLTLSGSNVYFSINNGATNLYNFNTFDANGGDPQDWATTTPYTADSFNAFSLEGYENIITPLDINTLSILGYTPAAIPEPQSLAGLALLLLIPALRRSKPPA
jgi:hypothetical protein